jgi:hypothetical protein
MKKLYILLFLSASIVSCKTDFEVNAPFNKVPIVYGIIEQTTDTQFIKINRTYLATNVYDAARVNDSSLFTNVTARVEQYTNGILGNVYPLQEIWVKNIDQGIFYTDSQKVYYFVEPNLNVNSQYKLIGTGDGKEFSAETSLIQPFDYTTSFKNSIIFNGFSLAGDLGVYTTVISKWFSAIDGKRYDLSLRFNYEEHKGANISTKYIDWNLGSQKVINIDNINQLQATINGESFYQFLGNNSDLQNITGVTKRVIKSVDLTVTAVNENLNTYIDVNEPVTTIITERPEFTNIENGYGIFASRVKRSLKNRPLSEKSVKELAGGQYTGTLLFCSDSTSYVGETYYCL